MSGGRESWVDLILCNEAAVTSWAIVIGAQTTEGIDATGESVLSDLDNSYDIIEELSGRLGQCERQWTFI